MRTFLLSIGLLAISFTAWAQAPKVIHMADLQEIFDHEGEELYVVNFWATWCRPCVAELPYFDNLQESYADKNVKVLLVSLDFVEDIDSKVVPFMKRRGPSSEVVLLDEPKYNEWIDKISPEWTGALPATIFIQKSRDIREFHEGDYTQDELFDKVETLLNQ